MNLMEVRHNNDHHLYPEDSIPSHPFYQYRWLQDINNSSNSSSSNSTSTTHSDAQVVRATLLVYGSLLVFMFLLFCWARRRFPRPYQLRNWVSRIQSPIAKHQYGFFSWIWHMNAVTEDEILAECGLDSLCILRLLGVGYKIALLSIFNAVWLMPLYATATPDATITDPFVTVTIANVASGSTRLIGTVIAAYILFGYVMYLILREFEWFTEKRHKHLQTPVAENYTVYVRNIDPEYRSNAAMADYFAHCFTAKSVLEAKLRIRAPTLSAAVAKRDKLVEKLEHALNYERVKQETPMHRPQHLRRRVPSIPLYASELRSANQDVVAWMDTIQRKTLRKESERPLDGVDGGGGIDYLHITEIIRGQWKSNSSSSSKSSLVVLQDIDDTSELYVDALEQSASLTENDDFAMLDEGNNGNDSNSNNEPQQRLSTRDVLNQGVNLLTTKTLSVAKSAAQLIPSTVEGDFYSAGFVTFSSLGFTQAALQMVHHAKPFDIEVSEAPRPNDIFWTNVGRSHKDLQIGRLVSFAATAALCLLWTIPMTFIASLSSVQALSQKFAFIGDLIQKFPFIGKVLEILAPLFVRLVNSLLPTILRYLTLFEGPVSESVVSASLFTKLAAFMIIQTFFVSAVSSSLLQELANIAENPTEIIKILAVSLPSQSTYFVQIVFVGTVLSTSLELLRVTPLAFAFIRRFLPPNLTEKERQKTVLGIQPLADPGDFGHADNLAQIVLNFIVMLVYAVIAPLTVFIQAFCFLFTLIAYKHQFVYIYPSHPDSGGKIWVNFVSVLLPCLLIAEFTIVGLMALQKAVIATPLMIPLIVITILFNAYVRQEHFRVAKYLPSRECMKVDRRNGPDFDLSFAKDAYLQEELRQKVRYPEDLTEEMARVLGLIDESEIEYSLTRPYGAC